MSLATTRRDEAEKGANMKEPNIPQEESTARVSGFATATAPGGGCGANRTSTFRASSTSAAPVPFAISVASYSGMSRECNRTVRTTSRANVINSANQAVTWSVQEGSAGGAITNTGVYTAPPVDSVYHIVTDIPGRPLQECCRHGGRCQIRLYVGRKHELCPVAAYRDLATER